MKWLNDLLAQPITLMEPSRILSLAFLYRISVVLIESKESYIESFFDKEHDLYDIFKKSSNFLNEFEE